MKSYNNHLINYNASFKDGLIAINQISHEVLCLFVVDDLERLVGTLTDGDIRRALISGLGLDDTIKLAMKKDFTTLQADEITPSKLKQYRIKGIKLLPCIDGSGKIIKVYDLETKQSILPIDAVLMAGGKGIRLRPFTDNTPKPLLKVGSKAIIDYNVDRLILFGVESIHVTVNYLAEQIESHFSSEVNGIKIKCVKESQYLGTMGAVKSINEFHHETVLVMNSDLFTNIDFEDFYDDFLKSSADMAVAAIPYSISVPYGIFELEEAVIKGIKEKPTYNYYANGGIYFIKRKLLELIPDDTFFDATDFIEILITKGYKVVRFPLIGYWIDIGKPEDFKKVQEFVKHIEPK